MRGGGKRRKEAGGEERQGESRQSGIHRAIMVRVWGGEQTPGCPLTKQRVKTLLVNHSSLQEVQPQHIKNKNCPGKVSFLFATRQLNPFLVWDMEMKLSYLQL